MKTKLRDFIDIDIDIDIKIQQVAHSKGYTIGPVYHATDFEFTQFDVKFSKMPLNYPLPFFFSFNKKYAEDLDKKIILECYLYTSTEAKLNDSGMQFIKDGDYSRIGNLMISVRYPWQIKLANITYDNKGNKIPLTKRFDKTISDIRY